MSLRESVERASTPFLVRLGSLPRIVPALVVLALMVAGALVPGWGWVLLLVVVAFLVLLLMVAWPHLRPPERMLRVAVIAMVLAITVVRALPGRF